MDQILSRGPSHLGGKPCFFVNGPQVLSLNPMSLILFMFGLNWVGPLLICGLKRLVVVVSVVDKLLILNLATKEHRKLSYVCVC